MQSVCKVQYISAHFNVRLLDVMSNLNIYINIKLVLVVLSFIRFSHSEKFPMQSSECVVYNRLKVKYLLSYNIRTRLTAWAARVLCIAFSLHHSTISLFDDELFCELRVHFSSFSCRTNYRIIGVSRFFSPIFSFFYSMFLLKYAIIFVKKLWKLCVKSKFIAYAVNVRRSIILNLWYNHKNLVQPHTKAHIVRQFIDVSIRMIFSICTHHLNYRTMLFSMMLHHDANSNTNTNYSFFHSFMFSGC